MKTNRYTDKAMSTIYFKFGLNTKFNHDIFTTQERAEKLAELVAEKCKQIDVEPETIQVTNSSVRMILECPANLSPEFIITAIKEFTDYGLQYAYPELKGMGNVWNESYSVTTELSDVPAPEDVPSFDPVEELEFLNTLKDYIDNGDKTNEREFISKLFAKYNPLMVLATLADFTAFLLDKSEDTDSTKESLKEENTSDKTESTDGDTVHIVSELLDELKKILAD